MEILTEFDGLQEALKKVKMDESVMPYVNGRLVDDAAFNKTQKILDCPEMISAHKYLYNLDMDQLTEEEINKIDQLYKLGCDRGFIVDDLTDWDKPETPEQAEIKQEVKVEEPAQKPVGGTLFKAKVPCWTVIYSATSKDGSIKTGEAYSNAISASAAKADVNAKLSRIGYSNISILAIEATDACDCTSAKACIEDEEVVEDDMLDGRVHNNHVSEADDEEEPAEDEGAEEEEETEEDNEEDSSEEDSSEDEEQSSEKDDAKEDKVEDTKSEESTEASSEEEEDDSEDEESSDDSEEEESSEEGDDGDDGEEKEELDANEKAELKDKYRKTFKNVLVKCKFETSFNDLTLEQKVKFFTELSKAWKKNEPTEFMTDKEVEQLNNIVVKENADEED